MVVPLPAAHSVFALITAELNADVVSIELAQKCSSEAAQVDLETTTSKLCVIASSLSALFAFERECRDKLDKKTQLSVEKEESGTRFINLKGCLTNNLRGRIHQTLLSLDP
jgi:hypothetical protein